jgi:hypothetical protein
MNQQRAARWMAVVMLTGVVTLSGQSAAPARQDEVLPALLMEVKGLRAAMEQMASAGPRVQLFASRLQLQEARINNMIRRLDTVRDRIGELQQEVSRLQTQQKEYEAAFAEQRQLSSPEARQGATQASVMLGQVKTNLAHAGTTLNRQIQEEAQLVADLATEQARWNAINQQLDELERALAKR